MTDWQPPDQPGSARPGPAQPGPAPIDPAPIGGGRPGDGRPFAAPSPQPFAAPSPQPFAAPFAAPSPQPFASQAQPFAAPAQPFAAPAQPYAPPPPYGYPSQPPPYPPYGQPPAPTKISGLAIASLVLGLCGGVLLSVIFGVIALGQTKPGGRRGRGLAVAGLTLSALWTVVFVVVTVLVAVEETPADTVDTVDTVASSTAPSSTPPSSTPPSSTIAAGPTIDWVDLAVGDCLNQIADPSSDTGVPSVPCARPHQAEVFALFTLPDGVWPGQHKLDRLVEDRCWKELARYAPSHADDDALEMYSLYPTEETWGRYDDRSVTCIAMISKGTLTGSLKGKGGARKGRPGTGRPGTG